MNSVVVIAGQTLSDVAVAQYGFLDAVAPLAIANGLALTDDLAAGQVLVLPEVSKPNNQQPDPVRTVAPSVATVQPGQTLADLAVQYLGGLDGITSLAALNGLALTEELEAGSILTLPAQRDKRVVAYFARGGYYPATGEQIELLEGIDYWGIEFDFIVQ
jgi:predicted Zn-dependent protease